MIKPESKTYDFKNQEYIFNSGLYSINEVHIIVHPLFIMN